MNFIKRDVDLEEYRYVKAQRRRAKLEIIKWIKKYREENNGENPNEDKTQVVALELADFNHVNQQYLEVKIALINQNKMPFMAEEFYDHTKQS